MFNSGKKKDDDSKKALENASNIVNKGLMGGLAKAFMGQDFVNQTNAAIQMGNQALDSAAIAQSVAQNGAEAAADVLSIVDTGATVNMNPVVVLTLKVKPASGAEFQTAAQAMIPRISIPRAGDKLKTKYHPANPSQIAILQNSSSRNRRADAQIHQRVFYPGPPSPSQPECTEWSRVRKNDYRSL
jgi:hypothetical protein